MARFEDDEKFIQELRQWLREENMQKYESDFVQAGFGINDIKLFVDEDDDFMHSFIEHNLGITNSFDAKKIFTFLQSKMKQFVKKCKKRRLDKEEDDEIEGEEGSEPSLKKRKLGNQVHIFLYLDLVCVSKYHTNTAQ